MASSSLGPASETTPHIGHGAENPHWCVGAITFKTALGRGTLWLKASWALSDPRNPRALAHLVLPHWRTNCKHAEKQIRLLGEQRDEMQTPALEPGPSLPPPRLTGAQCWPRQLLRDSLSPCNSQCGPIPWRRSENPVHSTSSRCMHACQIHADLNYYITNSRYAKAIFCIRKENYQNGFN